MAGLVTVDMDTVDGCGVGFGGGFALIVVLFILLIIIGASFIAAK